MIEQSKFVLDLKGALEVAQQAGWSEATLRQISRVLKSGLPDNVQIAQINAIMCASGDHA